MSPVGSLTDNPANADAANIIGSVPSWPCSLLHSVAWLAHACVSSIEVAGLLISDCVFKCAGKKHQFGTPGEPCAVGLEMYQQVTQLQTQQLEDPHNWVYEV